MEKLKSTDCEKVLGLERMKGETQQGETKQASSWQIQRAPATGSFFLLPFIVAVGRLEEEKAEMLI